MLFRSIYGTTMMYTPKMPKRHYDEKLVRNRIFDQVRLIRILYPDNVVWKRILADLEGTLENNKKVIDLAQIGFPDNWKDYLK